MRNESQLLLMAAKELPLEDIPRFLGDLEEIRCTAMARLTAPAPAQPRQADELLDITEAARRLGVSKDFLYHRHREYPFTRRVGRRLLFSALEIDKYIRQQAVLTARQQRRIVYCVVSRRKGGTHEAAEQGRE